MKSSSLIFTAPPDLCKVKDVFVACAPSSIPVCDTFMGLVLALDPDALFSTSVLNRLIVLTALLR